MRPAVIAATGLYTPPDSISNAELVEAFNAYVERFNAEQRRGRRRRDAWRRCLPSSVEFIEKASGIKSRYVVEKSGILNPALMRPDIPERPNEQISILAEIAVKAADEALERWGKPRKRDRRGDLRGVQYAARLSRNGHRGPGCARASADSRST